MKKLTLEQFIIRSKFIHNNLYQYDLVDYKNSRTKIKIICQIHGIFEQVPNNHLRGYGCTKCKILKLTTILENFIYKAKKIHNDKYDYSLVNFNGTHTKIEIFCPIHRFILANSW